LWFIFSIFVFNFASSFLRRSSLIVPSPASVQLPAPSTVTSMSSEPGSLFHENAVLRRELEKAQSGLLMALEEARVLQLRRDWAFAERDKIVAERESEKRNNETSRSCSVEKEENKGFFFILVF
jgi:hypothetical protein